MFVVTSSLILFLACIVSVFPPGFWLRPAFGFLASAFSFPLSVARTAQLLLISEKLSTTTDPRSFVGGADSFPEITYFGRCTLPPDPCLDLRDLVV